MTPSPQAPSPLRHDGHLVEALLLFLKQLTAGSLAALMAMQAALLVV